MLLTLATALLLVSHSTPVHSISPASPRPSNLPLRVRDHIRSLSTASPITHILNQSPTLIQTTSQLISFFEHLGDDLQHSIVTNRSHPETVNQKSVPAPTCNNHDTRWHFGSRNYMKDRGWAVAYPECITDIMGIPSSMPSYFSYVYLANLIVQRGVELKRHVPRIAQQVGEGWTQADFRTSKMFAHPHLQCKINQATAFRIDGEWHLATGISRIVRGASEMEAERVSASEYVGGGEEGGLRAAMMELPSMEGEGIIRNASTVEARWGDGESCSSFIRLGYEENLGVLDAVRKGEKVVEGAEESVSGWNVGMLSVPMVLVFVPAGLIGDVSTGVMLFYALLTDVITTVPMVMKGLELVDVGGRRFDSVVTRMWDVTVGETVAAETWVVECGSGGKVRVMGWVFVVAGMFLMVVGIVLELVVRKQKQTAEFHLTNEACRGEGVTSPLGEDIGEQQTLLSEYGYGVHTDQPSENGRLRVRGLSQRPRGELPPAVRSLLTYY